jgi:hypothetical protein
VANDKKTSIDPLYKYSKELANYFAEGNKDSLTAKNLESFLSSLPEEMQFQIIFVFLAAQRQTANEIEGITDELTINETFYKYFIKYIDNYKDKESKYKLFEILGINNKIEYQREISEDELNKIKTFYKYYYDFYKISNDYDEINLNFLKIFSEDSNFINLTIRSFNKHNENIKTSIPINYALNIFLPLSELIKELNEFKENAEFMARSFLNLQNYKNNDSSYITLINYINFSHNNRLGESIFEDWERFLFVYNSIDNPERLKVKMSSYLLKIGRELQKKFNMCLNNNDSDLRKQVKKDFSSALKLIESSSTGKFPY